MKLTTSEHIILGLVSEMPRHGYDIENTINERGIRAWTDLGFSSIYYILNKLQQAGYVKEISSPASKRVPKRYEITPAGTAICKEASLQAITNTRPLDPGVLIGIANSALFETDELRNALNTRIQMLEEKLSEIKEKSKEDMPDVASILFDYSINAIITERDWLVRTTKRTKTMDKIDFRKTLKELYAPKTGEFSIVTVPELSYLMVDGEGNPNTSPSYTAAVEALYSVAYTLKFMSKRELGKDYVVPPLEGLWSADDPGAFVRREKDQWKWTMMIMQPEWITPEHVARAKEMAAQKRALPALSKLRFDTYTEGVSVQIMHIGSYDDETPTLKRLHSEFMPEHNFIFNGKHHEIYIGDPRKAAPEKLKTVLRQPVKQIDH